MYCSLDEAWDSKNSIDKLSKRYNEHFNNSNELEPYIIKDSTNKTLLPDKSPVFLPRRDARYNNPKDTVYNNELETRDEIYTDTDLRTEDILLKTDEFKIEKKERNGNDMNCHELIEKVMKCSTCKEILIKKLKINNNFSFNSIINNEVKEVLILIMIGLVIIIAIDILIRVIR